MSRQTAGAREAGSRHLVYNTVMLACRMPWGVAALTLGLVLVGLSGCGLVLDTGPKDQSGGKADGGRMDAGQMDAGQMDAGRMDAGASDASADGATFDAAVDAGGDAAAIDASVICPNGCNDGNQCTLDSCDFRLGHCVHTPLTGTLCTDGSFCTSNQCQAGQCTVIATKSCGGNATCQADTGLCTCDPGYARCNGACVPSTSIQCSPGMTSGDPCGTCGVRLCQNDCTWGACTATGNSTCATQNAVSCDPATGACSLCLPVATVNFCAITVVPGSCQQDSDCLSLLP